MFAKKLLLAFALTASGMFAQTPAPPATTTAAIDGGEPSYIKPETPAQRKARLGTSEDPGTNPDPGKTYWRYGLEYHIEKFDRRWESYEGVEAGYVRPYGFVNVQREIYQRNAKYVWVWMSDTKLQQPAEEPAPSDAASRYTAEQINYLQDMRTEFAEWSPKPGAKTIRFEESSEGLPTSGSWRNSAAVADMNGDGCPDIIAPPERKAGQLPAIF